VFAHVGHNTDGKYFVTNTKLGFSCETRPRRVMVFIEKSRDGVVSAVTDVEVQDVVCGQNHVVSCHTFIYAVLHRIAEILHIFCRCMAF